MRARIDALGVALRAPAALSQRALRLVAAAVLVVFAVALPQPPMLGDGVEYTAVLTALMNHATPDLRAADTVLVQPHFEPFGYSGLHPNMLINGRDGRQYTWHFWLYPLLCTPAALLLRTLGLSPTLAFVATNTALVVALASAALWSPRFTRRDRMLVALTVVSPLLRYLIIVHPEAFTCVCVLASLIALNHRRHGLAALCAACGAVQNPPVAALVLFSPFLALYERNWRGARAAAVGSVPLFIPPLYYLATIGQLNPIAAGGFLDLTWGVVERAWGLVADLDQGLLVYVPGLIILAACSLGRARSVHHVGLLLVFCAFLFGAATNVGANSPFPGIMRYTIWMLPLLAWLAAEALQQRRRADEILVVVLFLHGALVAQPPLKPTDQGRLSTYALANWAAWYHPAPGTFADRVLDLDLSLFSGPLPIGFMRGDGVITKLLVDPQSIAQLDARFIIDPLYRQEISVASAKHTRLFYLNPPDGAVRSFCPSSIHDKRFRDNVHVQIVDVPTRHQTRQLPVTVDIGNDGEHAICNLGSGGRRAHNILMVVRQGPQVLSSVIFRRAPPVLLPGATERQIGVVGLPARRGRYEIDLRPSLDGVAHGNRVATLIVDVFEEPSYHANVRVAGVPVP